MKSVKLHHTQSQTWRVLLDGNVHPLLVGFHTFTQAIIKLIIVYKEIGPIDQDSLREMNNDLKSRAELWDGDEKYNLDIANARQLLNNFIRQDYAMADSPRFKPTPVFTHVDLLSKKHNPTDEELVDTILQRNSVSPNLRLTDALTGSITYGILMDDKQGKETWLIGAAYNKAEAEAYLNKIKTMFEKAVAERKSENG